VQHHRATLTQWVRDVSDILACISAIDNEFKATVKYVMNSKFHGADPDAFVNNANRFFSKLPGYMGVFDEIIGAVLAMSSVSADKLKEKLFDDIIEAELSADKLKEMDNFNARYNAEMKEAHAGMKSVLSNIRHLRGVADGTVV
jgi:hypothetical protein